MIFIDSLKCTGCGQCTRVCPFTVLQLNQEGKAENTGKKCIACMHCAAVCPTDAITYDSQMCIRDRYPPVWKRKPAKEAEADGGRTIRRYGGACLRETITVRQ